MGLFDAVTKWFRKEAADVKEAVGNLETDLSNDLARKERELTATPEEKIAMIQEDSTADDLMAEIQAKIDKTEGHALATEEVANLDKPADRDPADRDPADEN